MEMVIGVEDTDPSNCLRFSFSRFVSISFHSWRKEFHASLEMPTMNIRLHLYHFSPRVKYYPLERYLCPKVVQYQY